MHLETQRLALRPVTLADTPAIAEAIFGDPDVVAYLAHDTRTPEAQLREAAKWTRAMAVDGEGGIWDRGGLGLFTMEPRGEPGRFLGVTGFYMEPGADGLWSGEYFYALASAHHGQGLMSEAADALTAALDAMDRLGVIYATYWDGANEASGRLLRRTGLRPAGRRRISDEYDAARCAAMAAFDLWRLSTVAPDRVAAVAPVAARRLGALAAEGHAEEGAVRAALDRLGNAEGAELARRLFEGGLEAPGIPYLERRADRATETPVNRLGGRD